MKWKMLISGNLFEKFVPREAKKTILKRRGERKCPRRSLFVHKKTIHNAVLKRKRNRICSRWDDFTWFVVTEEVVAILLLVEVLLLLHIKIKGIIEQNWEDPGYFSTAKGTWNDSHFTLNSLEHLRLQEGPSEDHRPRTADEKRIIYC